MTQILFSCIEKSNTKRQSCKKKKWRILSPMESKKVSAWPLLMMLQLTCIEVERAFSRNWNEHEVFINILAKHYRLTDWFYLLYCSTADLDSLIHCFVKPLHIRLVNNYQINIYIIYILQSQISTKLYPLILFTVASTQN